MTALSRYISIPPYLNMADERVKDRVSVSLDGKLISRIKQLKYIDGSTPKFVWSGSKEVLGELIFLVFEK